MKWQCQFADTTIYIAMDILVWVVIEELQIVINILFFINWLNWDIGSRPRKEVTTMPDKKLTDKEIPNVKELLEYKAKAHCELCDLKNLDCCNTCIHTAIKQFIELFNRLQAENEDIKFLYENLKEEHLEIIKAIKHTKAETYKEFAERLKEKAKPHYFDNCNFAVPIEDIDNLLKELVGE